MTPSMPKRKPICGKEKHAQALFLATNDGNITLRKVEILLHHPRCLSRIPSGFAGVRKGKEEEGLTWFQRQGGKIQKEEGMREPVEVHSPCNSSNWRQSALHGPHKKWQLSHYPSPLEMGWNHVCHGSERLSSDATALAVVLWSSKLSLLTAV